MQTIHDIRVTEGMLRESGAIPTKLTVTWQVRFLPRKIRQGIQRYIVRIYAITPEQDPSTVLSVYPS